jgi:hypothetical protein
MSDQTTMLKGGTVAPPQRSRNLPENSSVTIACNGYIRRHRYVIVYLACFAETEQPRRWRQTLFEGNRLYLCDQVVDISRPPALLFKRTFDLNIVRASFHLGLVSNR